MSIEIFLKENNLYLVEQIAKGWTSFVYLVKDSKGKKFVVKSLREKANRRDMVERETENLTLANSVGVGPKLIDRDFENNVVLLEFIEGSSFIDWLFSNPKKIELEKFLKELFEQAEKLDKKHIDHGQLAGKGKNILVRKGKPVIIDFEKASTKRKVGNVNQLKAFLFLNPHSTITKKVKEILESDFKKFLN
ncbi:MAG: RIO1 family regulatory kinase/ATPase [Candidatus Diapherotrites archaeon]